MTEPCDILICARCSNPMHVIVLEEGASPSVVVCPYCQAENACELGGSLVGKPVKPQEETYLWTNETRRDASSGLDLHPQSDRSKDRQ
jgi:hypothetical protein